jgi:predicted DNA-binding transcriptional regulator AlpA
MNEQATPSDRLLTRAEVEVNFGLSRRFLEVSAVRGDGPPMVRIGRSVRYRAGDLRAWIEARRVSSTSQAVPGNA